MCQSQYCMVDKCDVLAKYDRYVSFPGVRMYNIDRSGRIRFKKICAHCMSFQETLDQSIDTEESMERIYVRLLPKAQELQRRATEQLNQIQTRIDESRKRKRELTKSQEDVSKLVRPPPEKRARVDISSDGADVIINQSHWSFDYHDS
jgi:hypothetical protein